MNKEIQRAEEAKRVLAEPLLQESFTAVESAIFTELRRVDVGARDRQRDLVVTLQLLGTLKQYLENTMLTGEMVRIQEERGSWTDRLKRNRG